MEEPHKKDKCPLCSCLVPVILLDSHVNAHLDDEEVARDRALAKQIASSSYVEKHHGGEREKTHHAVRCDRGCSQDVPIQEWDSHCLQHKLALEDAVAETSEGGVSNKVDYRTLIDEKPSEDNLRDLVRCQVRETHTIVKEGLMTLLQRCLEADQRATYSTVALAGYVEHYENRDQKDFGWGCGWRNIQMLASYLLAQDLESKRVLFGGCGFVPDIVSLQQWLEIAWSKGFDEPGADHFNWEIFGTHKWIGTTECAALLRSFGIYARIVDFQAIGLGNKKERVGQHKRKMGFADSHQPTRSRSTIKASESSRLSSQMENDKGACTVCGEHPIRGVQYHHTDMTHLQLCISCMERLRNNCEKHEHKFVEGYRVMESFQHTNGSDEVHSNEATVKHQHLVDWVWSYFTERLNQSLSTSAYDRLRQPIILSRRSPLYFQHEGHSRTIVGIERRRRPGMSEEVYLIVLDPSQKTEAIAKALRDRSGWQRLLKRGLHTLREGEYQLCYVDQGVACGEEYESLKVIDSVLYPS